MPRLTARKSDTVAGAAQGHYFKTSSIEEEGLFRWYGVLMWVVEAVQLDLELSPSIGMQPATRLAINHESPTASLRRFQPLLGRDHEQADVHSKREQTTDAALTAAWFWPGQ